MGTEPCRCQTGGEPWAGENESTKVFKDPEEPGAMAAYLERQGCSQEPAQRVVWGLRGRSWQPDFYSGVKGSQGRAYLGWCVISSELLLMIAASRLPGPREPPFCLLVAFSAQFLSDIHSLPGRPICVACNRSAETREEHGWLHARLSPSTRGPQGTPREN